MTQPDHEEQTEVIAEGRYRPKECASRQKRRAAAELFAAGIGYTKASRILDLPVNTLRDWAKPGKRANLPKTFQSIFTATMTRCGKRPSACA